jgi:trimeric autotransporter adhesin
MAPAGDPAQGASQGVSMSSESQSMAPIGFTSAQDEAKFLAKLEKAGSVQVRLSQPDDQDVEGHFFSHRADVVLVRAGVDDDDVEGHVISIHFPDAEQARHFRNTLIAAGALTASLALGMGAGQALAPSVHTGTAQGVSAPSQIVFMDTSAALREAGSLSATTTHGTTLTIPVGSASDAANQARIAAGGAASADAATKAREGVVESTSAIPGDTGAALRESGALSQANPAAQADAARAAAGLSGSLAGTPTAESVVSQSGDSIAERAQQISAGDVNPAAAGDAARAAAGLHGSLAGVDGTAAETPVREREAGALSSATADSSAAFIPQAGAAVSAEDQINAEIAAAQAKASGADASAAFIPQAGTAMSAEDQINAEIAAAQAKASAAETVVSQSGDSIAERAAQISAGTVNPAAAADAARAAAGLHGSLAGSTSAVDSPTKAREAGALSSANSQAAADAARAAAGIHGSLAGTDAVNPAAEADAARAAAGLSGSLAGTPTAESVMAQAGDSYAERAAQASASTTSSTDTSAQIREGGSETSSTPTSRAGDSLVERSTATAAGDEGDATPNSGFQP